MNSDRRWSRRPTYGEFIRVYANDPDWIKLQERHCFEADLRRALAGDAAGFREIAIYAPELEAKPRIIRALWMAGVPVRPHRQSIRARWRNQSSSFVEAFADDLDQFFRDAGFGAARLTHEFDVWRGGSEPIEQMVHGRSWTCSYSVACGFALQNRLWRNARSEKWARELGYPEPLVINRRICRDHAFWIGDPEREVVLTKEALALPARSWGFLLDWRRHRARKEEYIA